MIAFGKCRVIHVRTATVTEQYTLERPLSMKLSNEVLLAAIEGFESQKKKIDNQIAELRQAANGGRVEAVTPPETPMRKRRKFSAASRRRMKAVQQRRWKAVRGEKEPPASISAEAPKRKRHLSAAGRRAIIAAPRNAGH
jgi:hypothetical protein